MFLLILKILLKHAWVRYQLTLFSIIALVILIFHFYMKKNRLNIFGVHN